MKRHRSRSGVEAKRRRARHEMRGRTKRTRARWRLRRLAPRVFDDWQDAGLPWAETAPGTRWRYEAMLKARLPVRDTKPAGVSLYIERDTLVVHGVLEERIPLTTSAWREACHQGLRAPPTR